MGATAVIKSSKAFIQTMHRTAGPRGGSYLYVLEAASRNGQNRQYRIAAACDMSTGFNLATTVRLRACANTRNWPLGLLAEHRGLMTNSELSVSKARTNNDLSVVFKQLGWLPVREIAPSGWRLD